ncbi:MAG: 50S ribosomal protein L21 [Candidatus Niyogibacteria bacterium]|nr:50S ribosomal protein L21 [Candidatus Niyogibacteria bacterium]
MTFAVVKIGGKQYLVSPGMKLRIEKMKAPSKEGELRFDDVLLFGDESKIEVGKPKLAGAEIKAELVKSGKAKKVIVFHYKAKTRRRTKKGHRQAFDEILIKEVKR